MTRVVVDASAGVELVADTARGRELRKLIPREVELWVPEHFYIECAAVLRRWDLRHRLPRAAIDEALQQLLTWPLRVAGLHSLLPGAWALRANVTLADGVYVALAARLRAPLLTDDSRLAGAPNLSVEMLR